MSERHVLIALGTASADGDIIHGRVWMAPLDEEALEKFAGSLTEMCGEPVEWISGDGDTDGRLSMLFREDGSA